MDTVTKTDRRILRTKEAINKAFLDLFSEKEFDRITIHDISERANVNRGTVYLHFTDKYDLLNKCIEDHLNNMIRSCTFTKFMQKNDDLMESIEALKSLFIYFEENFLFFSSMLASPQTPVFRERMQQIITAVIQEKLEPEGGNKGMDKELVTIFTASAFVGTVEWWISNQMPHSPQYMAEQVWGLFERHHIS